MNARNLLGIPLVATLFWSWGVFFVSAETPEDTTLSEDLRAINEEITEKKAHVDQINRKIDEYREQIEKKQNEAASLGAQMEILDNRIAKSELEIEATEESLDLTDREIGVLDEGITRAQAEQDRQRDLLKNILQEINVSDGQSLVEVLFGYQTFSEMFDQLQYLEMVNADLRDALLAAKKTEASLSAMKTEQEAKRASLLSLQDTLKETVDRLEDERASKEMLVSEVQQSEAQFATLLYELKQEEQSIEQQVSALQADLEQRLYDSDAIGDSSVLSWPVEPLKGLSTTFHDPTYPFRNLFEHSGIDIPTSVGTAVGSAAPGYVAWTREGRLYGYYVMVIHTDGIATLYAHLSKILVEPEEFVTRGQAIGLSGGRPGMAGAGLSTGPHLHFEVRKDGIPTDPLDYLIAE